jgi:hypothetical protein
MKCKKCDSENLKIKEEEFKNGTTHLFRKPGGITEK